MKTMATLSVLSVIVLSGCTSSVHPILTNADFTKDVNLSGTWRQHSQPDTHRNPAPFVIEADGYNRNASYDVVAAGQEFTLQIGRIGDGRYMQFIRSDLMPEKANPFLASLPVYGFARFERKGEELRVYPINDRIIRKLLKNADLPYRNYAPGDMREWCILTAQTSELQTLIRESGKEMFSNSPLVFRRVPPSSDKENEQSHSSKSMVGPVSSGRPIPPTSNESP